jgi:hypothetical protein
MKRTAIKIWKKKVVQEECWLMQAAWRERLENAPTVTKKRVLKGAVWCLFHDNQNLDSALLWKDGKLCFGCNICFSVLYVCCESAERWGGVWSVYISTIYLYCEPCLVTPLFWSEVDEVEVDLLTLSHWHVDLTSCVPKVMSGSWFQIPWFFFLKKRIVLLLPLLPIELAHRSGEYGAN